MAIAVSVPTVAVASTTNGTSYAMGAFTPAANAILVCLVTATGTVASAPTMTGGSLKWIFLGRRTYNTTDSIHAFYAVTPASPASCTPTFDCSQDAATGSVMEIFSFTGADLLTPIVQSAFNATTAANPVATFSQAMKTLNGYCSMIGTATNPPGATIPGSWTLNANTGYTIPAAGAQGAYRAGGETIATVTYTLASAPYGIVAVEVMVDSVKATVAPIPAAMGSGGIVGLSHLGS